MSGSQGKEIHSSIDQKPLLNSLNCCEPLAVILFDLIALFLCGISVILSLMLSEITPPPPILKNAQKVCECHELFTHMRYDHSQEFPKVGISAYYVHLCTTQIHVCIRGHLMYQLRISSILDWVWNFPR